MVRNYRLKNKYCRNTKLSEDQFKTILNSWVLQESASEAGFKAEVDGETARKLMQRIRRRVMEDERISGWMGGGKNSLPPKDDQVWHDLYSCILECPAYQMWDESIPISVEMLDGLTKELTPDEINTYAMLSMFRNRHRLECKACPLSGDHTPGQGFFAKLAKSFVSQGKPSRSDFKEWFFELNFRANVTSGQTKYIHNVEFTMPWFLDFFEQHPL